MEELHKGSKWLFRISGFFGSILLLFILFQISSFWILRFFLNNDIGMSNFIIPIIISIVFILLFSEVYARLSYNNWKYELCKDELKIERGIIIKRYVSIPYNRIQNIDIHRGILARLLGFSTIDIQTAGAAYSNRGAIRSEGYIPAVGIKRADEVRNFMMKKISKK